jgi:secondary thiamine-phosphate synthase enzyme
MLNQHLATLNFRTPGRGLLEITSEVRASVAASGIREGLLTLFLRHTSASLLIQENADPQVLADLERFFARLVRDGDPLFEHRSEGADDMPAHVRSALTATQLAIPIAGGELALGTWQGVYLWEHRLRGHSREIVVHAIGEPALQPRGADPSGHWP